MTKLRLIQVTFDRRKAKGYPSKVRIVLQAMEPLTLWAPTWKPGQIKAQEPFGSGLESWGQKGWTGQTVAAVTLKSGETARAWVGLDPTLSDAALYNAKGQLGTLVLPTTDELGERAELEVPV